MWNITTQDGDRMRRRMAEALVHERLPARSIRVIVCINEPLATRVAATLDDLGQAVEVRVEQNWFF
jgi:hypothetical protein